MSSCDWSFISPSLVWSLICPIPYHTLISRCASINMLFETAFFSGFRELQLQGIPRRLVMNSLRPNPGRDGLSLFTAMPSSFASFSSPTPHKICRQPSKTSRIIYPQSIYADLGFLSRLETSLICRSVCCNSLVSKIVLRSGSRKSVGSRTRRQGLLELLGLLGVLQGQGVQVLGASDLELDQGVLLVLLDPGGCQNSGLVRSQFL